MHDLRDSGGGEDSDSEDGEEHFSFEEGSITDSRHSGNPQQRAKTSQSDIEPVSEETNPEGSDATITLTDEGEWWVASDVETGVTSQGKTRIEALENLDEAVAGYNGEGQEPTDEELREIGIDPENNVSGEPLPDEFL